MENKRIEITDGHLVYGTRQLGLLDQLVCDSQELPAYKQGSIPSVKHIRTPHRIDFLFAAHGLVVGSEAKLPSDLVSSHACRRLARQMRILRAVVDRPVLLLRDFNFRQVYTAQRASRLRNPRYREQTLWGDLIRYQQAGIQIMFTGPDDEDVLEMLQWCQSALGQSESIGAFMGDDRPANRRS